jgi:desulfoferrodoxin-like iron-binding protein
LKYKLFRYGIIPSERREAKMTEVGQKYFCDICGNEVVVTANGAGELVCCGVPMEVTGEGFKCEKA